VSDNKKIEDEAIAFVMEHLEDLGESPRVEKKGVDIISGEKWIEVKGSRKRRTNLRVTEQTLRAVEEADKWDDFYIYYVYDLDGDTKLRIFDNETFQANKFVERVWIIQPNRIKEKKKEPVE